MSLKTVMQLLATVLFYISQWQLDLWASPYVWNDRHWLEVLPFWFMWNTEAYVLFFGFLNLSFWVAIISTWNLKGLIEKFKGLLKK